MEVTWSEKYAKPLTRTELRRQVGCLLRDVSRGLSEYTYREKEARKLMSKGGRALLGRREERDSSSIWYGRRATLPSFFLLLIPTRILITISLPSRLDHALQTYQLMLNKFRRFRTCQSIVKDTVSSTTRQKLL
jgi:hypothetical protein